jgi:microcystin-dependent protein
MAISQNETLFQLIGTIYGGDGQSTFALPDFQGRVPIHQGSGFAIGQKSGSETVTLTTNQIPAHSHTVTGLTTANSAKTPGDVYGGGNASFNLFVATPSAAMNATMIAPGGGSQPHDNNMPTVVLNFIISLFGIFPSQN